MTWDPQQYQVYAAERARPFRDLVDRAAAMLGPRDPAGIVDLGCGPGTMTVTLADRWPAATVLGVDSSPEMIASAAELARPPRLTFELGDVRSWRPAEPVDLIVSNAVLQWVPGHVELLRTWAAEALAPGGVLAVQMPSAEGNAARDAFQSVATSPRWADRLGGVASAVGWQGSHPVRPPAEYVELLSAADRRVDVWETTYFHVLPGDDPVLEWFAGTGLRPYLDVLAGDAAAREAFGAEVAAALRTAYPRKAFGTVLPFRRIFVVTHKVG